MLDQRDYSLRGHSLPVAKYAIWQLTTRQLEGCTVNFISQVTGYSKSTVRKWLNELFVEDKVYKEKGKWYPEMAVSIGYHFHTKRNNSLTRNRIFLKNPVSQGASYAPN